MRQRYIVAAVSALTFAVAGYGAWSLSQQDGDAQTSDAARLDRTFSPPEISTVEETDGRLRITGSGEPSAIVTLSIGETRERSVPSDETGEWSTEIAVEPESAIEVSVESYVDELGLKGDQTVLRVPAPGAEDGIAQRPLILVTSPGGPSRVVQTPFGDPLRQGPLALLVLEYDQRGGTVFAGLGEPGSVVTLESARGRLGSFPVGEDGRWFSVIVEPESFASRDYTLSDESGRTLDVAFEVLPSDQGVRFTASHWQVRRQLEGGGTQVAVVFATPVAVDEEAEG